MGEWRMRPPIVGQGPRPICWAAALSSWTHVTRGETPRGRDELVDIFRAIPGMLNPDGSLQTPAIRSMATLFHLRADLRRGGGTLTQEYLEPKIKRGYVLVIFRPPGSVFTHTRVLYGVDRFNICFMDPVLTRRSTGDVFAGDTSCEKIWEFGLGASDFLVLFRE